MIKHDTRKMLEDTLTTYVTETLTTKGVAPEVIELVLGTGKIELNRSDELDVLLGMSKDKLDTYYKSYVSSLEPMEYSSQPSQVVPVDYELLLGAYMLNTETLRKIDTLKKTLSLARGMDKTVTKDTTSVMNAHKNTLDILRINVSIAVSRFTSLTYDNDPLVTRLTDRILCNHTTKADIDELFTASREALYTICRN